MARGRRGGEDAMMIRTIEWLSDADQALVEARRTHQPVLLDFSAAPT